MRNGPHGRHYRVVGSRASVCDPELRCCVGGQAHCIVLRLNSANGPDCKCNICTKVVRP